MAGFRAEQSLVRVLPAAVAFRPVLEQPAALTLAATFSTTAPRIHRIAVQLGAGKGIAGNVSHWWKPLLSSGPSDIAG